MQVVVCGAGAIGACTAYFLAKAGADVTLVERASVAGAASGKSGGFLALDWCDGQPVQSLARRSFHLHQDLAGTLPDDYGYRRMTTFAGHQTAHQSTGPVDWVSPHIAITQRLGGPATTAQVDPAAFTRSVSAAAQSRGARVKSGCVNGVALNAEGSVRAVRVDGEAVPCDAVVIAMGPWSTIAAQWLPLPAVFGIKGHSLVYQTGDRLPPEALFLECRGHEGTLSPEVFPRANGTTYVCAISSHTPVPLDPAAVRADAGAHARLERACAQISPLLADSAVLFRQACFRPICEDGWPIIGALEGVAGAYVATGHSVWGILNAPATGEALAELIQTGTTTHVNLDAFTPGRLPPLDPLRQFAAE